MTTLKSTYLILSLSSYRVLIQLAKDFAFKNFDKIHPLSV